MSVYRSNSGVIALPSWPANRTVAIATWVPDVRRVEVTWHDGIGAVRVLEGLADDFLAGKDMIPLANRRHEVVGFRVDDYTEIRAIPVASPFTPALLDKARTCRLSDWRLGADALIQSVSFDTSGEEICTEDVSGVDAWHRLMQLICDPNAQLIGDADAVYGVAWDDGSREEMWDCDEMTYSEYLENLAAVIQEWESGKGGE